MTVVGGAFRGIGVGGEVEGPQWGGDVIKVIPEESTMDVAMTRGGRVVEVRLIEADDSSRRRVLRYRGGW